MARGIRIRVWGDYALFTRPEMKVERCSYDVITPSAARGILEAIYWHPGMTWKIDRIHVRHLVEFTSVRRNEIKNKVGASNALAAMNGKKKEFYQCTKDEIVQRASLVLKDVEYVIDAHFEMTEQANFSDNEGKFKDIIMRRLKKGQCYHNPYFGCREFPVHFEIWDNNTVETAYPNSKIDLGYMLYDLDYSKPGDIQPIFFRAMMINGVINVEKCEVFR